MPKTVTQLYAQFERALANLDASPYPHSGTGKKKYDATVDKCTDLADRIVATPANPANPVPEMLLKIAAAGWSAGTPEPLDRWTSCGDQGIEDCLVSIRADLQAMQAAPPRRASRRTGRPERVAAAA